MSHHSLRMFWQRLMALVVAGFLVFVAGAPHAGAQSSSPLTTPRAARPLAADDDGFWDNRFSTQGTDNTVKALAVGKDGTLYAGGEFTAAGGVAANYIARWNGSAWQPLGSGMRYKTNYPAYIEALAVGRDGTLYAGGNFTIAGGTPARGIARWDGAAWHALDSGMDQQVESLMVGLDGSLYAGGKFTQAGTMRANSVARWDGSAWHPLGAGLAGGFNPQPAAVYALAIEADGSLYAGGNFTVADGKPARGVARWDGSNWRPLGSGVNEQVYALAMGKDGTLFVGGAFFEAGGEPSRYIAAWR